MCWRCQPSSRPKPLQRCEVSSGVVFSTLRAATALEQIRTVRTIQYPFEPFAHRVWELRDKLTFHDAWHVALAEWLGVEFVTADERLAGAPGLRCAVRHPGGG